MMTREQEDRILSMRLGPYTFAEIETRIVESSAQIENLQNEIAYLKEQVKKDLSRIEQHEAAEKLFMELS